MYHLGKLSYECSQCGITAVKMSFCSACMRMRYCSVKCQKEHWPTHKDKCHSFPDVRKELRYLLSLSQKYHLNIIPLVRYGSIIAMKETNLGIKVSYLDMKLDEECRLLMFKDSSIMELHLDIKDSRRISYDRVYTELSNKDKDLITSQVDNADVIAKCIFKMGNDILLSWSKIGSLYVSTMNRSANNHIEFFSVIFKDESGLREYLLELLKGINIGNTPLTIMNRETGKKITISDNVEIIVDKMIKAV